MSLDDGGDGHSDGKARGISRRSFLRRTLVGAALLAVGGTLARNLSGYAPGAAGTDSLRVLSAKEAVILTAVARRILAPDEQGVRDGVPSVEQARVVENADAYLAGLPPSLRDDVRALLQLLEHSPILFTARLSRFTHLDEAAQDAVLRDWETSRLDVRRLGYTALKRLAILGYYGDARTFGILGYAALDLGPGSPGRELER